MAKLVLVSLSERRSITQYQKSVRSMQTRALLCLTDSGHLKLPTITMLINWIMKECLMQFAWRPHYLRVLRFHRSVNLRISVTQEKTSQQHVDSECSRHKPVAYTYHLRRKSCFQPRAAAFEVNTDVRLSGL